VLRSVDDAESGEEYFREVEGGMAPFVKLDRRRRLRHGFAEIDVMNAYTPTRSQMEKEPKKKKKQWKWTKRRNRPSQPSQQRWRMDKQNMSPELRGVLCPGQVLRVVVVALEALQLVDWRMMVREMPDRSRDPRIPFASWFAPFGP
jgi:hypothetical protein